MKKVLITFTIIFLMFISFFFGAFLENYRNNVFKLQVHLLQYNQVKHENYDLLISSLKVLINGDYNAILTSEVFLPPFLIDKTLSIDDRMKIVEIGK